MSNNVYLYQRQIDILSYHLRTSNMTYETKNTTFSRDTCESEQDSQSSRTLPMNVAVESAHCVCEKNSCKDWAWSKMCGSTVEYDQRQSIVSKCDTQTLKLVQGKVCIVDQREKDKDRERE